VNEIDAHVLAMTGSAEHFFNKNLAAGFMSRLTRAASATLSDFGPETGGQLHCRNGAYHLLSDTIFSWTAGLPRHGPGASAR
jgi:hypothetical protein